MKGSRFQRIGAAGSALLADAERLGLVPGAGRPGEDSLQSWEDFHRALARRLEWADRVLAYQQAFDRLRAARPLERLACDLTRMAEESARNALELWQCWLRLRPSRWNPERRKLLSEYVSLLRSGSFTGPCTRPACGPCRNTRSRPTRSILPCSTASASWMSKSNGENYHRNWDGELCRRDQIRSRRLNDLDWDILRFWVYEIRDDLEGCLRRVKEWIASGG